MKHGPFILITESPVILKRDFPGVARPEDLSPVVLSNIKAVILDTRLDEEVIAEAEAACLVNQIPSFFWTLPEDGAGGPEAIEEGMLEFLEEQNEWKAVHPSPNTVARLERQMLVDIITTANSHLEPQEVMRTVMTYIHELIACEAWSVLILDNNADNTLSFAVAFGPGKDQLANLKVPFGKGVAGWVAKHRQPVIVNNAQEDSRFLAEIDQDTNFVTRDILCAPLVSRGRTIGVIEMLNKTGPGGFTEQELELVQVLVNPAAVAIENAYLFQKAQRLTIQDDLTRLYNSRHLNHSLEVELKRARRNEKPLSIIFMDLDGFKAVNDNYGHLVGSQALVGIGEIIRKICRESDIAGRYGGDEFMLILPDTSQDQGYAIAEQIRDHVAAYKIKELRVTASIGLACFPDHADGKESLMRLADKAMYKVKQKGKNGILRAHEL